MARRLGRPLQQPEESREAPGPRRPAGRGVEHLLHQDGRRQGDGPAQRRVVVVGQRGHGELLGAGEAHLSRRARSSSRPTARRCLSRTSISGALPRPAAGDAAAGRSPGRRRGRRPGGRLHPALQRPRPGGWTRRHQGLQVVGERRHRRPARRRAATSTPKRNTRDFVFRFEFKLTPGANNGIGIRAPLTGDAAYVGMEIQVLDDTADQYKDLQPYQYHGSIYGVVPARRGLQKPVGEWNAEEIIARGRRITVILNGTVIVDADIDAGLGRRDGRPPRASRAEERRRPHRLPRPRLARRVPRPADQGAAMNMRKTALSRSRPPLRGALSFRPRRPGPRFMSRWIWKASGVSSTPTRSTRRLPTTVRRGAGWPRTSTPSSRGYGPPGPGPLWSTTATAGCATLSPTPSIRGRP